MKTNIKIIECDFGEDNFVSQYFVYEGEEEKALERILQDAKKVVKDWHPTIEEDEGYYYIRYDNIWYHPEDPDNTEEEYSYFNIYMNDVEVL